MPVKLDLNSAWDGAITLIGKNREMLLVLAGIFFFLPYVVFMLLVPMDGLAAAGASGDQNAMMAAANAFFAQYWWAVLLLGLIQLVGATAIMAVIGDPARPTVNEAMSRGVVRLPSQIGAQFVVSLVLFTVLFVAILIGALTGSQGVAMLFALFSLPVVLYIGSRLSLAAPEIAIDDTLNPLKAIRTSWNLTKGTGLRLAAFYLLLIVAFLVIGQVIGLLLSLLTALPTAQLAEVLDALLSGLLNAAFGILGYAVLASVHRQMARSARVRARGNET